MYHAEVVCDIYDADGELVSKDISQGREYDAWLNTYALEAALAMINHCGAIIWREARQLRNARLRIYRCAEMPVSLAGHGGYFSAGFLDDYIEHVAGESLALEGWDGPDASDAAREDLAARLNATLDAWAAAHHITTGVWLAARAPVLEVPLLMVNAEVTSVASPSGSLRSYDLELSEADEARIAALDKA